ncbi:MAG TPA: hypothetical protein VL393_08875 [Candidatus Binataceae bacterium]|nr:hypothetical protein [Candidatus Binataceae bacterium]
MALPDPEGNANKDQACTENLSTEHKTRPTSPLTQLPRVPIDIPPNDDQHRAKEEAYWEWQTFWQKVTALAAIGAFLSAAIYACYAHRQVTAMQEANRLANVNALASDRPWLGPSHMTISDVEVNKVPVIIPYFTNYGKSPAIAAENRMGAFYETDEPSADRMLTLLKGQPIQKLGAIFPGEIVHAQIPINVVTSDDMRGLDNRTKKLIVLGEMTYKDSGSEITHHSWLYAMYAPDKKFMALQRVSDLPPDD